MTDLKPVNRKLQFTYAAILVQSMPDQNRRYVCTIDVWTFIHSKKQLSLPTRYPLPPPQYTNPSKQLLNPHLSPPFLSQAACSVEDAYFIICKQRAWHTVNRTTAFPSRRKGSTSACALNCIYSSTCRNPAFIYTSLQI